MSRQAMIYQFNHDPSTAKVVTFIYIKWKCNSVTIYWKSIQWSMSCFLGYKFRCHCNAIVFIQHFVRLHIKINSIVNFILFIFMTEWVKSTKIRFQEVSFNYHNNGRKSSFPSSFQFSLVWLSLLSSFLKTPSNQNA